MLRLPDFDQQDLPGGRLIRRAVFLVLATFIVLATVLVAGAALIRVDRLIEGNGILAASSLIVVRTSHSGIIANVFVKSGDSVVAGQPLAELDATAAKDHVAELSMQLQEATLDLARREAAHPFEIATLQQAVRRSENRLFRTQVQARQRLAEMEVPGTLDDIKSGHVIGRHVAVDLVVADLRDAEADLDGARTQLARTELSAMEIERGRIGRRRLAHRLIAAESLLHRLVVRAPASGVVLTDMPERILGSVVREGDSLLQLAGPNSWVADVVLDERDIHRVRVGDSVRLEVPAIKEGIGEAFDGLVESVATLPGGTPNLPDPRGYRVVVSMSPDTSKTLQVRALRPGFGVHAKIVTESQSALTAMMDRFFRGGAS